MVGTWAAVAATLALWLPWGATGCAFDCRDTTPCGGLPFTFTNYSVETYDISESGECLFDAQSLLCWGAVACGHTELAPAVLEGQPTLLAVRFQTQRDGQIRMVKDHCSSEARQSSVSDNCVNEASSAGTVHYPRLYPTSDPSILSPAAPVHPFEWVASLFRGAVQSWVLRFVSGAAEGAVTRAVGPARCV